MAKKIIKQNLRFYSKFLLLIGALIAFICSFGVSSYAWSVDSNGNLVSDNLQPIYNKSSIVSNGVTWSIVNQTLYLNGTSNNGYWTNISSNYFTLESGSYTIQWFTDITFNGVGFGLYNSTTGNLYQLNNERYRTFTINSRTTFSIVVWWSSSGIAFNNNYIKSMVYGGSYRNVQSFEPYGVTYYPYSRVQKEAYTNYGVYQFIDSIKIEYNTGSSINTYNTYTSPIISNPLTSPLSFSNGSLILSYDLLNDILDGANNWYYVLTITFKNNRVKISDFNQWNISTIGNNLTFLSYSNTTYTKANATGISYSVNLTDNGFNSSEYLKSITLNITGYANNNMFTQIGSPNDSLSYMYGFNYGYEKGKDDGFDSGFDDGKKEGIDIGYREGYRDAEESNFTTNGFKTLIGSIFNYPINMIRSIFNFEFMGINIYSIIVFIMSIGIVIFVIRRFKK